MPKLMDSIRAAAFDLDGTLIDTMPDLVGAINAMLRMLGCRELPESRVPSLVGSGVDQLVLRSLTESLGGQVPHTAQLSAGVALFRKVYGQSLFERSQIYPGVTETLQALADKAIALCCITNKDSLFALPLLRIAQLEEYFAFTLCADRLEDRKPNPHLLRVACSRFGIAPAEMVYVGDSGIDIRAARAAGCRVVSVSYGYDENLARSGSEPDATVDSFEELLALRVPSLDVRTDPKVAPRFAR